MGPHDAQMSAVPEPAVKGSRNDLPLHGFAKQLQRLSENIKFVVFVA